MPAIREQMALDGSRTNPNICAARFLLKPGRRYEEAVKLFAETEGLILDPVYTGKCAAAMIDHIRRGEFDRQDVVLFIHTGGVPAIFTHHHLWGRP